MHSLLARSLLAFALIDDAEARCPVIQLLVLLGRHLDQGHQALNAMVGRLVAIHKFVDGLPQFLNLAFVFFSRPR